MSQTNEIYKIIIRTWIDKNNADLEKIPANKALIPLKLILLGNSVDEIYKNNRFQGDEFQDEEEKAYILEASLYKLPFTKCDIKAVELSKEILSHYEDVYFANITCANYYRKEKNYTKAIQFYKRAINIAPNDESNLVDLILLLLLQENQKDTRAYETLLKNKKNIFFTKLGVFGMSSKNQKIHLGLILGFVALFTPYSFFIYIPALILLSVCYFWGRHKRNRLIIGVSINYAFYFITFLIISLLIHFL